MKTLLIAAGTTAFTLGALTLGTLAPAQAAGCLKGAAVGGVAGHVAGHHGLLGAGAGCIVGRHEANKSARQAQQTSAPTKNQTPDSNSTTR